MDDTAFFKIAIGKYVTFVQTTKQSDICKSYITYNLKYFKKHVMHLNNLFRS